MSKLIKNLVKGLSTKIIGLVIVSSMTFTAWAISLSDAKQQGLVGEMPNGYLGVVVNNTAASQLVKDVNAKRKNIYMKLARKNKITMEQVTALAGEKAIAKTRSGHFIKNASGKWIKK